MLSHCSWFPLPLWLSFPEGIVHLPHLQVDLEFHLTIPWGLHGGWLIMFFFFFFCQTCLWWDSQCIRVRAFIEWKGVLFDTEPSRYSGKYCFLEIPACCQFWFYLFISAWCLGSLLSFCIHSFYFGSYLFVYLYPYEYMWTGVCLCMDTETRIGCQIVPPIPLHLFLGGRPFLWMCNSYLY